MFCGLLRPLTSVSGSNVNNVLHMYRRKSPRVLKNLCALWRIVVDMASGPGKMKVVLALDALGRCAEDSRDRLLSWIVEVPGERRLLVGRLKSLLTGRPDFDIQMKFRGSSIKLLPVESYMDSLEQDIKTVASWNVARSGYTDEGATFLYRGLA